VADAEPDPRTQERVARNEALFREANERIDAAVRTSRIAVGGVPFLCECADPRCSTVIRMTPAEYRHVRSNPRWFLALPPHVASSQGTARVVEERAGYVVVEKVGRAGDVAETLAADGEEETRWTSGRGGSA
jgi:hypothetical protein